MDKIVTLTIGLIFGYFIIPQIIYNRNKKREKKLDEFIKRENENLKELHSKLRIKEPFKPLN